MIIVNAKLVFIGALAPCSAVRAVPNASAIQIICYNLGGATPSVDQSLRLCESLPKTKRLDGLIRSYPEELVAQHFRCVLHVPSLRCVTEDEHYMLVVATLWAVRREVHFQQSYPDSAGLILSTHHVRSRRSALQATFMLTVKEI